MTNFKKYILIILLFVRLFSFGQSTFCSLEDPIEKINFKKSVDSLIIDIEKQDFRTLTDKQQISSNVKELIDSLTADSLSIAKKKHIYRFCINALKETPIGNILFFSKCKGYQMISCLTGGKKDCTTTLVFKLVKDQLPDLWLVFSESEFESPKEVFNSLKAEKQLDILRKIAKM